ncbi:uncharacterized protein LOC119401985 [Rhipicephalus sanguineus]|uniref:uncharacterized protein LOC119401985 n=1 Tax=Rhipicephalus sanguineus TaxID=34632 RepID=UPI0020C51BAE|nr:uncharacterized protein LOC119401985 [Rhipicephalus sanguineus]
MVHQPAMEDQPAADQPAEKAPGEKNASLKLLASRLAMFAPTVFSTEDTVLDILTAADREFVSAEACDRRMSRGCTYDETDPMKYCWATKQHPGWTNLLGPRGIELIELDLGRLHFRTLNVDPDDLLEDDDAKFLCLCLWLLQEHRCISAVSISVPVVAPRHGLLFLSLLKLTLYVKKIDILGENRLGSVPVGYKTTDLSDASGSGCESCMRVLANLPYELRELGLSSMRIDEVDALALTQCLEQNKLIVALVLIDVEFSPKAFELLIGQAGEMAKLEDFRIKTSAKKDGETFAEALSSLGASGSLSRLYVHVDFCIRGLLNRLTLRGELAELALETTIRSCEDLESLCGLLKRRQLPLRLKMCLDMNRINNASRSIDNLKWIVGESCVRTLILSGSTINLQQSLELANALASSKLAELHLDECGIECEAVEHFARAIAERVLHDNFKELNVGAVVGDAMQQRQMFRYITQVGVRNKITVVCAECSFQNDQEWNILAEHTHFTKVSLSVGDNSNVDPVLSNLMTAADTLESLFIDSNGDLSERGGEFVANLIRKCPKLKVLRLRCRLTSPAAVPILAALEKSRNVLLLTAERWVIDARMGRAFQKMLNANRSLWRIEFYWKDMATYQGFKHFLRRGLRKYKCPAVLKMYQGEHRDEITERDPEILLYLQINEMALAWLPQIILRDRMTAEGTVLAELLDVYDAPLDPYQRVADFSLRTAGNRVRMALMNTRSAYYALRKACPSLVDPGNVVELQECLQNFVSATRLESEWNPDNALVVE